MKDTLSYVLRAGLLLALSFAFSLAVAVCIHAAEEVGSPVVWISAAKYTLGIWVVMAVGWAISRGMKER